MKKLLDVQGVRKDFPILETGLVYLDSAATSLTPEPVLQKTLEYYRKYRANVGRGVHSLSQRATEEYERVRVKVADFINARSESEIVMLRNATEGINLLARGLKWSKGDKIVTSILEHNSNFIVWLREKIRNNLTMEVIKPKKPAVQGRLDLTDFEKAINDQTKLVTITHVSNVLGVILPVREIAEMAHDHGAYVLVDGAQSVPHMKVDVQRIGCDFLVFSGHKMCAPTGTGVLYMREELMEEVEPLCIGGGTVVDVGPDYYKLRKGPGRFEAGTPAIGETIGLGAAVDYLSAIGIKNIEEHEKKLIQKTYDELTAISGVEVYGPEPKQRASIVSFNVDNLKCHDVALALDVSANIFVRSGYHCAQPITEKIIRKSGTIRASTYLYNTQEDIDKLASTIMQIACKG